MATTFNLENQISLWKSQLSKSGQFNKDNIEELESHLYDEIEQLQQYNLNDEEAYFVAQKRLGNIKDLKQEYGKVNRAQSIYKKMLPYVNGVFIYFFIYSFLEFTLYLSVYIAPNFLKGWGLLSYMLSNIFLVVLGISIVLYFLKNTNWQLLQLISFVIPPDYLLLSGAGFINATSWIKYFGKIQVILMLIFCVMAAVIYYKNMKADQIQLTD